MGKNYNLRLIKHRESYSFRQISEVLIVHPRTIQEWRKEGLKTISTEKPFLVMGYDLKEFLKARSKDRKTKLKENEFYCTRCRKAVESNNNQVSIRKLDKTIGKQGFNGLAVQGICQTCGAKLNKFSHMGNVGNLKNIFNISNLGDLADE